MYAVLYKNGTLTLSNDKQYLDQEIFMDYGEFDSLNDEYPWWKFENEKDIINIKILNSIKIKTLEQFFQGLKNLKSIIGLENFDVSDCEDFFFMFQGCSSITKIDGMDKWCIPQKDFILYKPFCNCLNLKEVYLPNSWYELSFEQFHGCTNIEKIHYRGQIYSYQDISKLTTSEFGEY